MPSPVDDAYNSEYSRPSETDKLRMPFFRGRYRLTGKTYLANPNPNPYLNPNPNPNLYPNPNQARPTWAAPPSSRSQPTRRRAPR